MDRPRIRRLIPPLACTCLLLVLLDQLSKTWALSALEPGEPVLIIDKFFSLLLGYNRGMAFGLFQGSPIPLIFSLVALAVIPVWIVRNLRQDRRIDLEAVALSVILGGNIGNLIDRVFRPDGVVDFIYIHLGSVYEPRWSWFPFNLADTWICAGVGLFLLASLRRPSESNPPQSAH